MLATTTRAMMAATRATTAAAQTPPTNTTPARPVAAAVDALSRRALWAARRDVMLTALERFAAVAYECTSRGDLLNLDAVTGAILIPVPWGRHAGRLWGLRRTEGDALRALLILEQRKGRAPWLLYSPESRRWYADRDAYPTAEVAREYLRDLARRMTWEHVRDAFAYTEAHTPTGGTRRVPAPMGESRGRG